MSWNAPIVHTHVHPIRAPQKNSPGPELNPNGRRVNLNRPKGVMKVVRSEDESSNGICQKPEAASRVVKYFAPDNFENISSARDK